MTRRVTKQKGFTLVELLLALAFLAFVLVFIVITIIQVMRTYNKGLAIKDINQTARSTLVDMTRVAGESDINSINTSAINAGRLCFGSVSYVWNIEDVLLNKFSGLGQPALTFVRVSDAAGALCAQVGGVYPDIDASQAVTLVDNSVWIEKINLTKTAVNALVDLDIQLATPDDRTNPALIYTPSAQQVVTCKGGTEGQFCSVARFTTTVSAMGGS